MKAQKNNIKPCEYVILASYYFLDFLYAIMGHVQLTSLKKGAGQVRDLSPKAREH